MVDILIINPCEEGRAVFDPMPPNGLGLITSYLLSNDYDTKLVDRQVERTPITEIIATFKPKIIGIGGTTHTRFESFNIARTAKEIDKNILVVYGGCHATFTAQDTLANIPEIDVVVRGEGEQTFSEIAEKTLRQNASIEEIEGTSLRLKGSITHNHERQRNQKLDSLPFPVYHLMKMEKYRSKLDFLDVEGAQVVSSRGCPIGCSFCSASAMFGKIVTLRSANSVVNEIELLLNKYHYKGAKFFDSTLTLRKSHITSICDEIIKRGLKFPWECEIRVDTVDKDILKRMKEAGCYYVDFGVESGSEEVLKKMNKKITLEQVINVLDWTKELKIRTKVFFTFGHIEETVEDSMKTIAFIDKYKKYMSRIALGIGICIYPGTFVETYARETGCLADDFSWTKPFYEKRQEQIFRDPRVPILTQSQMDFEELNQIKRALMKMLLRHPRLLLSYVKREIHRGNTKRFLPSTVDMFAKRKTQKDTKTRKTGNS